MLSLASTGMSMVTNEREWMLNRGNSSNVYSADIFHSLFREGPTNSKQGRRYRHIVLEKSGSQEETEAVADFLGQGPSTEGFYKDLGVP